MPSLCLGQNLLNFRLSLYPAAFRKPVRVIILAVVPMPGTPRNRSGIGTRAAGIRVLCQIGCARMERLFTRLSNQLRTDIQASYFLLKLDPSAGGLTATGSKRGNLKLLQNNILE